MGQNNAESRAGRGLSCSHADTDRLIGRLAAKQQGRVGRDQLLARGVSPDSVDRRLASGRLLLERPGVYAVPGAATGNRARYAVALLDTGPGSMVSNLSAAADWQMQKRSPVVIDITNARRLGSRDGIRVHHRRIHPAEIVRVDGLPMTSPAQTIFDLATKLGDDSLAKTANQGFVERIVTVQALHTALERNRGRRGSRAFRKLLDRIDPEGRRVRSPLEVAAADFMRARGFPPWVQNEAIDIDGETVVPDFLWREQRVYVEADGRDPHLAPLTFDSDRRKDRRARVRGWLPVRITWDDLDRRPDELEADLRALLAAPR